MRNGVDPRCLETMSMYEIVTMVSELNKQAKGSKHVTNEEFEQAEEMIRSVTLNDPNVRI